MNADMVNHPPHYQSPTGFECIDVTRYLIGPLANTFKYVYRFRSKGKPLEDLKKAMFYLDVYMETGHGKMKRSVRSYAQDLQVAAAQAMQLNGVLDSLGEYVDYLLEQKAPEAAFMSRFHHYLDVASNGRDYKVILIKLREILEGLIEEYEDNDK